MGKAVSYRIDIWYQQLLTSKLCILSVFCRFDPVINWWILYPYPRPLHNPHCEGPGTQTTTRYNAAVQRNWSLKVATPPPVMWHCRPYHPRISRQFLLVLAYGLGYSFLANPRRVSTAPFQSRRVELFSVQIVGSATLRKCHIFCSSTPGCVDTVDYKCTSKRDSNQTKVGSWGKTWWCSSVVSHISLLVPQTSGARTECARDSHSRVGRPRRVGSPWDTHQYSIKWLISNAFYYQNRDSLYMVFCMVPNWQCQSALRQLLRGYNSVQQCSCRVRNAIKLGKPVSNSSRSESLTYSHNMCPCFLC